jgi:deazaflavin-dependent oxidoreductase (nitroreductase family)
MGERPPRSRAPSWIDHFVNRVFGALVALGLGLPHNYLLQVRGRRSGRLRSTPVNVLEQAGRRFLVAPRGHTQWVRNARVSGQVTLRRGARREAFRLRELADGEKPELLKTYPDRFHLTVQRYFPVRAASPAPDLAPLAGQYPVFELIPKACGEADQPFVPPRVGEDPEPGATRRHPR